MGASDGDTGWLEANSGRHGRWGQRRTPACRIEVTYPTTRWATIAAEEADRRRDEQPAWGMGVGRARTPTPLQSDSGHDRHGGPVSLLGVFGPSHTGSCPLPTGRWHAL